jgi:hypothetical protein
MEQSTDTEIMTSLFISGAKVTPCKRTGVCPHGICLDRALLQLTKHLACHVEFLQARLKVHNPGKARLSNLADEAPLTPTLLCSSL